MMKYNCKNKQETCKYFKLVSKNIEKAMKIAIKIKIIAIFLDICPLLC